MSSDLDREKGEREREREKEREILLSKLYHTCICKFEFFTASMAVTPDGLSPRAKTLYDRVKDFIQKEVRPLEKEMLEFHREPDNHWKVCPTLSRLKVTKNSHGNSTNKAFLTTLFRDDFHLNQKDFELVACYTVAICCITLMTIVLVEKYHRKFLVEVFTLL